MKGLLAHAPTTDELARLYHELAKRGAPSVGRAAEWPYEASTEEDLLTLAAEMLRHDARLLSILLHWLLQRWRTMNPLRIRDRMHLMRWPQALMVVLAFARDARREDAELRYFADYLGAGLRPVSPPERFFLDVERPGSRRAEHRRGRSLVAYTRWGFVGTERPTADVYAKPLVGRYDAATRRDIARRMAAKGPFSIAEYLDAIDGGVGRVQAREDLIAVGLEVDGHGRGARWSRPQ